MDSFGEVPAHRRQARQQASTTRARVDDREWFCGRQELDEDQSPVGGCGDGSAVRRRGLAAIPLASGRQRDRKSGGDDGGERQRLAPAAAAGAAARFLEERVRLPLRGVGELLIELFRPSDREASIASTMLRVNLQRHPDAPELHEQVAAQIRRAIADGEAKPGERLPPARDLAAELGVNRNTVLRALRTLRDEGLLDFRRGRGVTVSGTPPEGALLTRVRELVEFGARYGYGPDELVGVIRRLSDEPSR